MRVPLLNEHISSIDKSKSAVFIPQIVPAGAFSASFQNHDAPPLEKKIQSLA
jgi:hypothetical protein